MKRSVAFLLICLGVVLFFQLNRGSGPEKPGDSQWLTGLTRAQEQARNEKKLVLILFTGSDWCPPCMQLDRKVLTTREFKDYAITNLVLVLVDFPDKKRQDDALKKANAALSKAYNVDGFPTIVVLNHDGKEIARQTGYGAVGPEAFIAGLENLKKKN